MSNILGTEIHDSVSFTPVGTLNIGAPSTGTGPDVRPNHLFLRGGVAVGNLLGVAPPTLYGFNNTLFNGTLAAGNVAGVFPLMGAGPLFNLTNIGYIAFAKDLGLSTCPGFVCEVTALDYNVYFSLIKRSTTRTDLLKFGADGGLTMYTTTAAFTPPKLTTTQRQALTGVAGMTVYDTTLGKLCLFTTGWEIVTSVAE